MSVEKGKYSQVTILDSDLNLTLREKIDHLAYSAISAHGRESAMADYIKEALDNDPEVGPVWNVIVGRCFGAYVTHETKHYYNFAIGHLNFLVWKSG